MPNRFLHMPANTRPSNIKTAESAVLSIIADYKPLSNRGIRAIPYIS